MTEIPARADIVYALKTEGHSDEWIESRLKDYDREELAEQREALRKEFARRLISTRDFALRRKDRPAATLGIITLELDDYVKEYSTPPAEKGQDQ